MTTKLGIILSTLLLVLIVVPKVKAANMSVVCNPASSGGDCVLSNAGSGTALFSETNLLPGDEVIKTFSIQNTSNHTCTALVLKPTITSQSPSDFLSRFQSRISEGVSPIIGTVNFFSLLSTPQINLGSLAANTSREFEWWVLFEAITGNAYQNASGTFNFDLSIECQTGDSIIIEDNGAGSSQSVTITKETSTTVVQTNNNTTVNYIIIVSNTGNNTIAGNTVVDLPPSGFTYVPGSWSAFSSKRGDLRLGGITPEPVYSSPGSWQLGEMTPGEVVTLSYNAKIDNSLEPGIYPDLAFAYGTGIGGQLVYANQSTNQFVGTQVQLVDQSPGDARYEVARSGQVLGATDRLPDTGVSLVILLGSLTLIVLGSAGVVYSLVWSRR